MKLKFGKFCGWYIDAVPSDYLDWLLTIDLREPLRSAIACEVLRRKGLEPVRIEVKPDAAPLLARLIEASYKSLAKQIHSDVTGSDDEQMRKLNDLIAELRRSEAEKLSVN